MKKKRIRFISVLISIMLVMGNAGAMVMADDGDPQEPLTYIYRDDYKDEERTVASYTVLSESTPTTWTGGFYFLGSDVTYTEPIVIDVDEKQDGVHLILGDGYTLRATEGIVINKGTFYVYTQSDDSGKIIANSSDNAGIGFSSGSSTKLSFCGGDLVAKGAADCAGIGGKANGPVGDIYVYGGSVTATGGANGAGIGTGKGAFWFGNVATYGGQVTAIGGQDGAGIGGGKDSTAGSLIFNGGVINAKGKGLAPGVGGYNQVIMIQFAGESEVFAQGGDQGGAAYGFAAGDYSAQFLAVMLFLNSNVTGIAGPGAACFGGGYGVTVDEPSGFASFSVNQDLEFDVTAIAGEKEVDGQILSGQAFGNGAGIETGYPVASSLTSFLTVKTGEDATPVLKNERIDACKEKIVKIEICDHPNCTTYTNQQANHLVERKCIYCEASDLSYGQEHSFNPQTHMCICGCKEYKVTVIGLDTSEWSMFSYNDEHNDYNAGDAPGTMYIYPDSLDREINVKNVTYVDPEDGQEKEWTQWSFVTEHSFTDRIPISMWMPESDVTFEIAFMMNVSFDCNGGSGSMDEPDSMERGTEYTLPDCGFTAPAGMIFAGWKIGDSDEILPAGEKVTVDTDLTLVAQWVEANQATIKSGNVDFDGCIRLIFRMNFSPDLLSDSSLHVEVEKHDETTYVYLDDTSLVSQKNGDYYISLPVPIPEFADDVTIRVVDGTGATVKLVTSSGERLENDSFTYSVMTYAENKQNSEDEKMAALAKALYWYGVASQNYFGYDSGKSFVFDESIFPATTANRLQEFKYEKSGERPDGVEKTTIKAYFESDNTLSITFYTDGSVPVSDYEIVVTDHDDPSKTVTANLLYGSRKVSVEVENIPAPELGKAYDFTISYGEKTYTITASPMTYALTSYQSPNVDRQHLGIAFFCYYAAAYDYFHDNGQI